MRPLLVFSALALVCGLGCGGAPKGALPLVPVSGSLIVNGKPLNDVFVQLIPVAADSKTKPGIATTDADGKFVIRTNGDKGANPGKYKVVLGNAKPAGPVSLEEATRMSGQYTKTNGIPKVELPYPTEWTTEKTTPKEVEVANQAVVINIDI